MTELVSLLGLPSRLGDVGVGRDRFPEIAEQAMREPFVHANPRPVRSVEDILESWKAPCSGTFRPPGLAGSGLAVYIAGHWVEEGIKRWTAALGRRGTDYRPVRARDHLSARLGDGPLRLPLRLLHVGTHDVPAEAPTC